MSLTKRLNKIKDIIADEELIEKTRELIEIDKECAEVLIVKLEEIANDDGSSSETEIESPSSVSSDEESVKSIENILTKPIVKPVEKPVLAFQRSATHSDEEFDKLKEDCKSAKNQKRYKQSKKNRK